MPTYEYECTKGHRFDLVQRISEEPLKRCRVCRAKVRRLVSAPAFILKGGGWYADGYSSSRTNGEKGDSAGASSEKGSDSKPAASGGEKSSSKSGASTTGDG